MVTSMFLHGGYLHLALNMYSLYYVGSILEIQIGRWQFLLLYFGSGIAGSAGAIVLEPATARPSARQARSSGSSARCSSSSAAAASLRGARSRA